MLRASCEDGSLASIQMKSGNLVGDDLVNRMVELRIAQPDCAAGFLLDGYPRTVQQAIFLKVLIRERRWPAPTVIHLDVPRQVLIARICSRRQCPACGKIYNLMYTPPVDQNHCDADGAQLARRPDDDEQVILERLSAYDHMTQPLIEYYRTSDYHRIDGDRPRAAISEEIGMLLESAPVRASRRASF
jgi:adenylate kinase